MRMFGAKWLHKDDGNWSAWRYENGFDQELVHAGPGATYDFLKPPTLEDIGLALLSGAVWGDAYPVQIRKWEEAISSKRYDGWAVEDAYEIPLEVTP